jgi:hypothetical protein
MTEGFEKTFCFRERRDRYRNKDITTIKVKAKQNNKKRSQTSQQQMKKIQNTFNVKLEWSYGM